MHGGGTVIWPGWKNDPRLSLKIMTLEIDLHHVYTAQGIPINVHAGAHGAALHARARPLRKR